MINATDLITPKKLAFIKRWDTIFLLACLFFGSIQATNAQPLWLTLPATPTLPVAKHSGFVSINGIRIW